MTEMMICKHPDCGKQFTPNWAQQKRGWGFHSKSCGSRFVGRDLEERARRSERNHKRYRDPNQRARTGQKSRERWSDPKQHARQSEAIAKAYRNPKLLARIGQLSRERWSDPKQHARQSEAIRESWSDPKKRAKQSELLREICSDPKKRAHLSAQMYERWSDPKWRAQQIEATRKATSTPEARARNSERSIKRWSDPKQRAKQSASLIRGFTRRCAYCTNWFFVHAYDEGAKYCKWDCWVESKKGELPPTITKGRAAYDGLRALFGDKILNKLLEPCGSNCFVRWAGAREIMKNLHRQSDADILVLMLASQ